MGYMKYIIGIIIAISLAQFLTGDGGILDFKDKGSLNTDAVEIKKTIDKVIDSQKTFQKLNGSYAQSVAGPFTKGLDPTGQGFVTAIDGFADKIKNKDGSNFDPFTLTAAFDKESYILEKNVKIYTAPVFETVTIDNFGNIGTETSFKLFVDASGYSANPAAIANIESEICLKITREAGALRTACSGSTAETVTSFDSLHSTFHNATNSVTATIPNSDGLVSASFVSKDKI